MTVDTIAFSALPKKAQYRVFAIADALREGDCLPLVPYLGQGAQERFENLRLAVPGDYLMASGYWEELQRIPFAAAFVLDAHGTEAA